MGLIGKRNIENFDAIRLLFVFLPFGESEIYCKKYFLPYFVRSREKYTFFILEKHHILEVINAIPTYDFNGLIYLVDKDKEYSDVKNFIKGNTRHNIEDTDFLKHITIEDFKNI